ncbi:MAG: translation initiation factor IF-2 [Fimbriimonadales bacterium]|nr:translation initiation factor IF-2 [Fimbriimonadales bacterium]
MSKVEIETLAADLEALPSQVSFVLAELGVFSDNGSVDLDSDTLELLREAVGEMVSAKLIALPPGATPRDIASALNVGHVEVQKALMKSGTLAALTTSLAQDVAERIVDEFGYTVKWAEPPKPKAKEEDKPRKRAIGSQPRAPIVTIMGHVDHGKTSLLDYIRKAKVAEKEFGGITQHIGAYQVNVDGKKVTFLDTPGHEAFTAMRARGASVTDIAILVVAADDGVMPQTIEAINHAKNAEVPIIVAINKIDRPEANVQKVKQQLLEHELVPTDFGGQVEVVPVSAMTGEGVDNLLETIVLQAELMELRADAGGEVEGVVIEARLDKGRGPVATILVESGTLKLGDYVLAGEAVGKIKAMFDFQGKPLKDAGPSTPAEILGLDQVPNAGETIKVFLDEREAKAEAERLREESRLASMGEGSTKVSLETLKQRLEEGESKELRIIIKGDVQGSVEAVKGLIEKIENPEVEVRVLHSGVGSVTETDILLASASKAIVVGFNTKVEPSAKAEAERQRVQIRLYRVIYELIEDIERAVKGMLEPKFEERYLGSVEIRVAFKLTKQGHVAGCYVTDGKVLRGARCRVKRDGEIVYEGKIESLKHIKEDVREMAAGFECGIQFENWTSFKEGDVIEAYEVVQVS